MNILYCLLTLLLIACDSSVTSPSVGSTENEADSTADAIELQDRQELEDTSPTDHPGHSGNTIDYLALGDSYTIGQGIDSLAKWPLQLKSMLSQQGLTLKERIIAQTGWTSRALMQALAIGIPDVLRDDPPKFDLISISIGVNNQYRGLNPQIYLDDLDSLFIRSQRMSKPTTLIFFVSIPDYGVTPYGANNASVIAGEIDQYNLLAKEKCIQYNIPFVDITPLSRKWSLNVGGLATDRLHPSEIQYKDWVSLIYPLVEASILNE